MAEDRCQRKEMAEDRCQRKEMAEDRCQRKEITGKGSKKMNEYSEQGGVASFSGQEIYRPK